MTAVHDDSNIRGSPILDSPGRSAAEEDPDFISGQTEINMLGVQERLNGTQM
jgi:hypothetical protein